MPFLLAIAGFFVPRVVLGLMWLFSDLLFHVYGSWLLPLLGFIFLPYTTLVYAILAGILEDFSFFAWMAVALALCLDISRCAEWGKKKHDKRRYKWSSKMYYTAKPGSAIIEGELN